MKLYIWGTGCGAGDLADHGLDVSKVCAFLDSAPASDSFLGRPVLRPEEVPNDDVDLILVASRYVDDIARKAVELGVNTEKLIFLKNNWQLCDRNRDYTAAEKILDPSYLDSIRAPQYAVREPLWVSESPLTARDLENDYVRMRTLEALCRELGNVPGAAAETTSLLEKYGIPPTVLADGPAGIRIERRYQVKDGELCSAGRYERLLAFAKERGLPMTLEDTVPDNAEEARQYLERIAGETL